MIARQANGITMDGKRVSLNTRRLDPVVLFPFIHSFIHLSVTECPVICLLVCFAMR